MLDAATAASARNVRVLAVIRMTDWLVPRWRIDQTSGLRKLPNKDLTTIALRATKIWVKNTASI